MLADERKVVWRRQGFCDSSAFASAAQAGAAAPELLPVLSSIARQDPEKAADVVVSERLRRGQEKLGGRGAEVRDRVAGQRVAPRGDRDRVFIREAEHGHMAFVPSKKIIRQG
jgi:hypothetical protein